MFHQYRREEHATQERAEALMALSAEQGFQLRVAHGSILLGWALAAQGQGVEMIAEMRQGLAAYQAVGTELARPYYLALLAEAYGEVGQTEAGLTVLAEALAVVDKTGERYWEAELHRLKGELLLALSTDKTTEAEACFRQALDIDPPPAGEVAGAAGGHEPGAPVAAPGQARRSPTVAGADLRLVHRGL